MNEAIDSGFQSGLTSLFAPQPAKGNTAVLPSADVQNVMKALLTGHQPGTKEYFEALGSEASQVGMLPSTSLGPLGWIRDKFSSDAQNLIKKQRNLTAVGLLMQKELAETTAKLGALPGTYGTLAEQAPDLAKAILPPNAYQQRGMIAPPSTEAQLLSQGLADIRQKQISGQPLDLAEQALIEPGRGIIGSGYAEPRTIQSLEQQRTGIAPLAESLVVPETPMTPFQQMRLGGLMKAVEEGKQVLPGQMPVPTSLQAERERTAATVGLPQSPMGKLLQDLTRMNPASPQAGILLQQIEAQLDPEALQTFKGALNLAGIAKGTKPYQDAMANYVTKLSTHQPPIDIKVSTMLPASEEAQKDFIKSTRVTYDQLKQAPSALLNIEKAKALIPGARGFMGPGGETLLEAAKFMNNRLGMEIDVKGIQNAEELRSRIFFNIMDSLKKMDAQPSQMQQMIMMDSLGKLGTDPNALSNVLDAFGDAIRSKVEAHNTEVSSAMQRGVKFPYDPTIKIPGLGPSVGTVENGYRFKGGDPSKRENWEQVK